MPSTIPLMVAIYSNPGINHWGLFVDAEDKADNTIIHLLGGRRQYFRDVRTPSDARISNSLIELCSLCQIDAANIDTVKNIAWNTPVRNTESDYSCQDFVLEVLDRLEREGVIDAGSIDYKTKKDMLKAKRESWKQEVEFGRRCQLLRILRWWRSVGRFCTIASSRSCEFIEQYPSSNSTRGCPKVGQPTNARETARAKCNLVHTDTNHHRA